MSNEEGILVDMNTNMIEIDLGVGPKGETPVKGVDYWTHSDRLAMFRDIRNVLSYDAQYDLSQEVLSDEISGEQLVYDHEQRAWRVFGEIRIAVPERSDYYLSIALSQKLDEGNIKVGDEVKPISDNLTFLVRDVEEVVFFVDVYIWIKTIAVQGFRPIIVPTKVSELKNDLGFIEGPVEVEVITASVKDETLFIKSQKMSVSNLK